MSMLEDIASDVVNRLEEKVPEFRRVVMIGEPEELEELSINSPSAGVVTGKQQNSDTPTPPGEEYVYIHVDIWFTATRFGTDHRQSGLSGDDGIYDLYSRIHEAMKAWTPTSGYEPMRFIEGDVSGIDDAGVILAYAEYRTATVI
jgi:hypothetical protein